MKKFVCEDCGVEFEVSYMSAGTNKVIRFCKECRSDMKRRVGMLGALSKNPVRNKDEVEANIKKAIIDYYNEYQNAPNIDEACKLIGIAHKTLTKLGLSYKDILSELELDVCSKWISKFQKKVIIATHKLYPNYEVITEKTFDDLVNPKSGYKLRLDIFIPKLNMAIECDGAQHLSEEHFYSVKCKESGFITPHVSDKIKEEYCFNNGIQLIRIPYNARITLQQVKDLLV